MKTIGMLGGMSWESTAEYYRIINERVRDRLGGLNSASILLHSCNFAEIERLQQRDDWNQAAQLMIDAAIAVERGGADFLIICTNTMHICAEAVCDAVSIPLLHIADATAQRVTAAGLRRVALLGTAFTMEREFYKGRLTDRFGLQVLTPPKDDRGIVHRIIYDELCRGEIRDESRRAFRRIINGLLDSGAQGVILGCTEIGLLIKPADSPIPIFDTTRIHAEAAVDLALSQDGSGDGSSDIAADNHPR